MGVSEYQLTSALSEELKGRLPSIEELEATLHKIDLTSTVGSQGIRLVERYSVNTREKK